MTLSNDLLRTELRRYADATHTDFDGWPNTRRRAREYWARAFDRYVRDLVITSPATVTPVDRSAGFDGVAAGFAEPLNWHPGIDARVPADELSAAWRAGVAAIALIPATATYSGAGTTITAIDPLPAPLLDARREALRAALLALFQRPAISAAARLGEIAGALHVATEGLATTCTYQAGGGSSTGPLVFG